MAYGINLNTRRWRVCDGIRCRYFATPDRARARCRQDAMHRQEDRPYEFRTRGGWEYFGLCSKVGDCTARWHGVPR